MRWACHTCMRAFDLPRDHIADTPTLDVRVCASVWVAVSKCLKRGIAGISDTDMREDIREFYPDNVQIVINRK